IFPAYKTLVVASLPPVILVDDKFLRFLIEVLVIKVKIMVGINKAYLQVVPGINFMVQRGSTFYGVLIQPTVIQFFKYILLIRFVPLKSTAILRQGDTILEKCFGSQRPILGDAEHAHIGFVIPLLQQSILFFFRKLFLYDAAFASQAKQGKCPNRFRRHMYLKRKILILRYPPEIDQT